MICVSFYTIVVYLQLFSDLSLTFKYQKVQISKNLYFKGGVIVNTEMEGNRCKVEGMKGADKFKYRF